MRRSILTIVSGILFLLRGAAIADTVVIPAAEPSWTDTGVQLGTDMGVTIQANGLACYDTADDCQNGEAWTGPDGIEEVADETFVVPGMNKYALVGKIGDDGDPFLVGIFSNVLTGEETGTLFLIYNDSEFSDNSGSYEAALQLTVCCCAGSAGASTCGSSPVYGPFVLIKHVAYLLLPMIAVVLLRPRRRKR